MQVGRFRFRFVDAITMAKAYKLPGLQQNIMHLDQLDVVER